MPITLGDIEAFFDRHPEFNQFREKTIKFVEDSVPPRETISSGTIEWIFPGTELVEKFFEEIAK
ncbi:MAG: hypothetical protein PHR36_04505, partial [Patescibacteria group bacterium]|nr:hypothetical protein [Patescibacteria group bacterium]